ncbi:MAG: SH3 domain-containing protein, partial [Agathobacter sp.]|nr:SH3 domain-containing protein [Agathobacter sp.]
MEPIVSFAYTAQTGMIYSTDKSALVETFYQASPNGSHARYFEYGKPVTVVDEVTGTDGAKWYKISYTLKAGGEETSYCPASNVLLDKDAVVISQGTINSNEVNLRNQPGTSGTTVLTKLTNGQKLEILDSTTVSGDLWYRVRTSVSNTSVIGWVISTYVNEVLPDIEVDEEYEAYLVRIGFPESYAHSLAILHAQYPNWVFEPVKTGLDWDTVIAEESKAARNLIQTIRDDAMKSYA